MIDVEIDVVDLDYVEVCGQRIKRPSGVSRSEWLEFWNAARLYTEGYYFTTE